VGGGGELVRTRAHVSGPTVFRRIHCHAFCTFPRELWVVQRRTPGLSVGKFGAFMTSPAALLGGSSRAPDFSERAPAVSCGFRCRSCGHSRGRYRSAISSRVSFVHGAILRGRDFSPSIPPVNSRYQAERSESPPIWEPSIQAPFLLSEL